MAERELETERLILRPPAPDDLPWVLEHMNTPAVVRYLGGEVRSPEEGQREIGWTFAEGFRGKGYATEAALAVIAYAFGTLGLPVLYSQTSDSNESSTRMMQRLGFTRRAELDYVDPDYPPADDPTTVWSMDAPHG